MGFDRYGGNVPLGLPDEVVVGHVLVQLRGQLRGEVQLTTCVLIGGLDGFNNAVLGLNWLSRGIGFFVFRAVNFLVGSFLLAFLLRTVLFFFFRVVFKFNILGEKVVCKLELVAELDWAAMGELAPERSALVANLTTHRHHRL